MNKLTHRLNKSQKMKTSLKMQTQATTSATILGLSVAMQTSTMQISTMQISTMQISTMQTLTVQISTMQTLTMQLAPQATTLARLTAGVPTSGRLIAGGQVAADCSSTTTLNPHHRFPLPPQRAVGVVQSAPSPK